MAERRLGVCVDFSPSSELALKWTMDNVVRENDHVFLICVNKNKNIDATKLSMWGEPGSPAILFAEFRDPNVVKNYGLAPVTQEFLGIVTEAMKKKKNLSVFIKVYFGDAREKLIQAIKQIPVHSIFMGSRGHSRLEKVLMGSVTLHVVNHSPIPVMVIRLLGEGGGSRR